MDQLAELERNFIPIQLLSTQSNQKNLTIRKQNCLVGWIPHQDKYVLIQNTTCPAESEIMRQISYEPETTLSNDYISDGPLSKGPLSKCPLTDCRTTDCLHLDYNNFRVSHKSIKGLHKQITYEMVALLRVALLTVVFIWSTDFSSHSQFWQICSIAQIFQIVAMKKITLIF